jgi:peroxin-1
LYGPTGCGKSLIVPALARKCNFSLVTCRGPEILDKYIGGSEANIRKLFAQAHRMAPSILFLDELESLAPRRGSDSTGVTDRIVNQLLTFLDGFEDTSSSAVYIIGATSRPDRVDPAIIRPGRLEEHLYVGQPESIPEWRDLLLKIGKNWNLNINLQQSLSQGDEIVNFLINTTPQLIAADIRALFDTAHLQAVHRLLAEKTTIHLQDKVEIDIDDMRFATSRIKSSLRENDAQFLRSVYSAFGHRNINKKTAINTISNLNTCLH